MTFFAVLVCFVCLMSGCENTDIMTATDAGLDAVKALALSDEDVQEIASKSARFTDNKNRVAPPDNNYAIRLSRLVIQQFQDGKLKFNYAVYLTLR